MKENLEETTNSFFINIQNNDITQVRKIFRNLEYNPWEFNESGGFNGMINN